MTAKHKVISQFAAPRTKLLLGSFLSLLFYPIAIILFYELSSGLWGALSGAAVEPPKVAFMSDYGEPAKNGYWVFVWSSILAGLFLSAFLPSLIGASIGKLAVGVRYVNEVGDKISLKHTLRKTLAHIAIFLLLALPGPIIGFSFGAGSEFSSSLSLLIGSALGLYVLFKSDESKRTWAYRYAQIIPIMKDDVEALKEALSQQSDT